MDASWQGTVLLADLRAEAGKLYAAAGPAKALQAIQQCLAVLEQTAWEGGATLVKTTGDEVMALFPAPAAAADAATVNAWLQRSGSSAPQVTLTTRGRVMRPH